MNVEAALKLSAIAVAVRPDLLNHLSQFAAFDRRRGTAGRWNEPLCAVELILRFDDLDGHPIYSTTYRGHSGRIVTPLEARDRYDDWAALEPMDMVTALGGLLEPATSLTRWNDLVARKKFLGLEHGEEWRALSCQPRRYLSHIGPL